MRRKGMKKTIAMVALAALLPAAGWAASGQERRHGPPPEALTACEGKSAGEAVQFTNRRGKTMNATCREMDGRLVALPDSPQGATEWGFGKKGGERHLALLAERLKLTDEQQEQVRAILAAEREKNAPLIDKMQESRAKLHAAIHSGAADEAEIRSLAAAQAEIKADLLVARARGWQQIHTLLTPEQRELAKEVGPFAFGSGRKHGGHWR